MEYSFRTISPKGYAFFLVGTVSNKEIEELSLKAIKAIHKHLDDDQDGAVNLQESNEVCFLVSLS